MKHQIIEMQNAFIAEINQLMIDYISEFTDIDALNSALDNCNNEHEFTYRNEKQEILTMLRCLDTYSLRELYQEYRNELKNAYSII